MRPAHTTKGAPVSAEALPLPKTEAPPETEAAPVVPPLPETDPKDGVFLRRMDGRVDLIMVKFPSLPVRLAIREAFRKAIGYVESDEPGQPTGTYQGDDALACLWAALGASWAGPDCKLPTLREYNRDVVAYGEAVTTALLFAGYGDVDSQMRAGKAILEAFMQELTDAERAAREGFQGARRTR